MVGSTNHFQESIAYLWLELVQKLKGISKQSSDDDSNENKTLYGLVNVLKEASKASGLGDNPARVFLRNVKHISFEQYQSDFRQDFAQEWEATDVYDENDKVHK